MPQAANSLALGTSPVVRALIDPEGGMEAIRNLDNISFADWFRSHGGSQGSIDKMWDPIGEFLIVVKVDMSEDSPLTISIGGGNWHRVLSRRILLSPNLPPLYTYQTLFGKS